MPSHSGDGETRPALREGIQTRGTRELRHILEESNPAQPLTPVDSSVFTANDVTQFVRERALDFDWDTYTRLECRALAWRIMIPTLIQVCMAVLGVVNEICFARVASAAREAIAIGTLVLVASMVTTIGAVAAHRVRFWWLAFVGCLTSMLTSPLCCLVTAPLSVEGLSLLTSAEVRAAFRRASR